MNANQMRLAGAIWSVFLAQAFSVFGQAFEINSISAGNGTVQVTFPGRSDSYYFLQTRTSLEKSSPATATAALLGASGNLAFQVSTGQTNSMFFQVEQIPLTSTNSLADDDLPDGWKLQHGLNPLRPSPANEVAPGDVRTWLEVYEAEITQAALPLAYFPSASSTVIVGASNATVQVFLTKPSTGCLNYQLSGTAIPSSTGVAGDYIAPPGKVYLANATSASISIQLVPEPDIEINRAVVIAIAMASAPNQTYTITTNSSVTTLQINQSSLGVFVGSLAITNGMYAGVQSVKMALRPGAGTNNMAVFDVTGNALLGNSFAVPVITNSTGFQLSGAQFANIITNTPWGRNLGVNLAFGVTTTNNATFSTPVTISLTGLTTSGVTYSGSGYLNLARSQ